MPHDLSLRDVFSGTPRHQVVTAWTPGQALLALLAMALVVVALQVPTFLLASKLLGAEAFNAQIISTGLEQPLMLLVDGADAGAVDRDGVAGRGPRADCAPRRCSSRRRRCAGGRRWPQASC